MGSKSVCIIGLGYVGLPLACLCARKNFQVFGLDIDAEKVKKINAGLSPIDDENLKKEIKELKGKILASTDEKIVSKSDIVVVCVPTPVDEKKLPNLVPLQNACKYIEENMNKNQLIIIESTINPGVMEEIVLPVLEANGKKHEKNFLLAHCPERIDPGNKKWNVKNIPRVVGGINKEATQKAVEFYESVLEAGIKPLSSVKAAEAVKIMENTFRDVNIAFVNELAQSFDKMNIDIKEVIGGASTKPFGFMPFFPGPGVGGHCISVDPYYLIERAKQNGFTHEFLILARKINESMPLHVVQLIEKTLNEKNKKLNNSKIAILGLAFKPNVDDIRDSPSIHVIEELKKRNANLKIFDPWIPSKSNAKSLDDCLKEADLVVLLTHHSHFLEKLSPKLLKQNNIDAIIDARNCLNKQEFLDNGILYKGIGR